MGTLILYSKLLLLINIINSDLCITHNPLFQHKSYLLMSSEWEYSVLILKGPVSGSREFQSSIKEATLNHREIKEIQKWLSELLFIPQNQTFTCYQLGLPPFKHSAENSQTEAILGMKSCALNLTLVFVKGWRGQSFHPILTEHFPRVFPKAGTTPGILFHRKHHQFPVLDHSAKKWQTNIQGKPPSAQWQAQQSRKSRFNPIVTTQSHTEPGFQANGTWCVYSVFKTFQRAVPETQGYNHRGIWARTIPLCHLLLLCRCILLQRPLKELICHQCTAQQPRMWELKKTFMMGHNNQKEK